MGDSVNSVKTTENTPKKSWFKGLKAEYKKIMWPDRKTLATQTTAVVVVSIALGIIISIGIKIKLIEIIIFSNFSLGLISIHGKIFL